MEKTEVIYIERVRNGFAVTIRDTREIRVDVKYVYNDYRDLIRDMSTFLAIEQEEEEEVKEEEEKGA